ncbi:YbaB/EbfC family nucleoid-associated protein, partial [Actinokineospora cianjurensis]
MTWPDRDPVALADTQLALDELRSRAADLTTRLSTDRVTESSPDGSVTVTLSLTGALIDLTLNHRACALGPTRLTATILQTTAAAQVRATHQVAAAVSPFAPEALHLITHHHPPHRPPPNPPNPPNPTSPSPFLLPSP